MSSPTMNNPSFAAKLACNLNWGVAPNALSDNPQINQAANLIVGNAAGQVDRVIAQAITITSGTPVTINVGTALDPSGTAAAMVHVCGFILINSSTTTGQDMTIGGGTNPVWGATPASSLYDAQANGGIALGLAPNPGYHVTASSADTFTIIVAAGTSVAGQIVILGRSA